MNFDGQIICAVPDGVGDDNCLWPFADVRVYAEGKLGEVDLREAVQQAIAGWNAVCGIKLALTDSIESSHIRVTQGGIDGSGRTLAWSELPCGFSRHNWRRLTQKYDTGEMWTISENPPAGKIDAVRVICHEIGHAIGISHITPGNLMAPTYSNAIRWPQRDDRLEAISRYGKVAETPTPKPDPVDPKPVDPTPKPSPSVPGWEKFFPCLLKYGFEFLDSLDEDQRKSLFRLVAKFWKALTPEQAAKIQELMQE